MRISKTLAVAALVPAALLVTGCQFTVSHAGQTATCNADVKHTTGACDLNGQKYTVGPAQSHKTPIPTARPNPTVTATAQCKDPDHDNDCDNNTDAHN